MNYGKVFFLELLLTFICVKVWAQDTIVVKTGQKIIATSIIEVNDDYVIYSKTIADSKINLKIPKANVGQISYRNGTVEKYNPINKETVGSEITHPAVNNVSPTPKATKTNLPEIKVALVDSFNLAETRSNFRYYDLLKSKSPVVGFSDGIYMVNEKVWFYKMSDSLHLTAFAVSHVDTSTYIFYDYKNAIYLINYKNDIQQNKETTAGLLKLDKKHLYTLFPAGKLSYYLLARDTISNLFFCNATSHTKVLSSKKNIYSILPIDADNYIACYKDKLVLYTTRDKANRLLFESPIPIISAVIYPSGLAVMSTFHGIYIINKDYTASKLNLPITDGILKMYNNYLYVLSNARSMIYKVKI